MLSEHIEALSSSAISSSTTIPGVRALTGDVDLRPILEGQNDITSRGGEPTSISISTIPVLSSKGTCSGVIAPGCDWLVEKARCASTSVPAEEVPSVVLEGSSTMRGRLLLSYRSDTAIF